MKLISVAAQFNSGKDEFSDRLVDVLHRKFLHKWYRRAFALPVKEIFCQSFGVDIEFVEKWKRIPEPPPGFLMPVRQALQFIGNGYRQIKADIWIDLALRNKTRNLIISDSRYINEAKAVFAEGGVNVLLFRPGFLNHDPNPSEAELRPLVEWAHANLQEGPIDKEVAKGGPEGLVFYDYFLLNSGTLADFQKKIETEFVPFVDKKLELS